MSRIRISVLLEIPERMERAQAAELARVLDAIGDDVEVVWFDLNGTESTPSSSVAKEEAPALATRVDDDEDSGEASFPCPHPGCDFSARSSAGVESHRRTHRAPDGSWPCWFEGCGQTFTSKYKLDAHRREHGPGEATVDLSGWREETEKPDEPRYACQHDGCSFTTSHKAAIVSHQRTHQPAAERDRASLDHVCPIDGCGHRSATKRGLRQHMSRTHPTPAPEPSNPTGRSNYVGTDGEYL